MYKKQKINSIYIHLRIDKTLRTMFWSIYLIGNSAVVEIDPFDNDLTLVFGYLIFGLYHIINITIMINMLIAMMARSYDSILVYIKFEEFLFRLNNRFINFHIKTITTKSIIRILNGNSIDQNYTWNL